MGIRASLSLIFSESQEVFIETQIVNYLEEHQFKIHWDHRDFESGTILLENIEDAIVHSRRMIFVISRYKNLTKLQKLFQILWQAKSLLHSTIRLYVTCVAN